jgi:hypothetical protein
MGAFCNLEEHSVSQEMERITEEIKAFEHTRAAAELFLGL